MNLLDGQVVSLELLVSARDSLRKTLMEHELDEGHAQPEEGATGLHCLKELSKEVFPLVPQLLG